MAEWWESQIDPKTGRPFANAEAANAYAMGQGQKEASSAFNTTGNSASKGYWEGNSPYENYDWKGGVTAYDPNHQLSSYTPQQWEQGAQSSSFGFANTNYDKANPNAVVGGNINPATGEITFMGQNAQQLGTARYDINKDYGLSIADRGIIPIGKDVGADGFPYTMFYYVDATGVGRITDNLEIARSNVVQRRGLLGMDQPFMIDPTTQQVVLKPEYIDPNGHWTLDPNTGRPTTGGAPGGNTAGDSTGQVTQAGALTDPGAGERRYAKDEEFYDRPTNAQKAWDQSANQPTASQQLWEGKKGQFNAPTESQNLYDQYKGYLDPSALEGFYDRQREKAQMTLDRKASSGGWGDSGAAARATANIGQEFADRELANRLQFMQAGMGMAGDVDTSVNQQASTAQGLASGADTSIYDKIRTGAAVDNANLAQKLGGMTAATGAQTLEEGRLTGGLDSARQIANDMAQLAMQGFTNQESEQFANDMQELSLKVQAGTLTADQAYKQAQELLQGFGMASSSVLNSWIINRLNNKDSAAATASSYDSLFA